MNKIALVAPAANFALVAVPEGLEASLTSTAEPIGSILEGGIFDDFALIGALVFGVEDAERDRRDDE
jgi:hypothetical protein